MDELYRLAPLMQELSGFYSVEYDDETTFEHVFEIKKYGVTIWKLKVSFISGQETFDYCLHLAHEEGVKLFNHFLDQFDWSTYFELPPRFVHSFLGAYMYPDEVRTLMGFSDIDG